ncbi:hypothetical protein [Chitinimonas sp.]|uniref:hypothetical protein n=1 Tax=Chitinimonas sp. TaxID=1934313 RepID=UPI002F951019
MKQKPAAKPVAQAANAAEITTVPAEQTAPKVANKVAPKAKAPAKVKAEQKTKPASRPEVATKPATKATKPEAKQATRTKAEPKAAPAPKAEAKPAKPNDTAHKKTKLVRDSFTFPEQDYALFAALKGRVLKAGQEVKKGELVRAGLATLAALPEDALLAAIGKLEKLKTGRPGKR